MFSPRGFACTQPPLPQSGTSRLHLGPTSAHPHRCPRPYTRSSLRLSQILRRPPQEYRTAPENSHKSPPPFYMSTAAASVALVAAVAVKDDHDEEEKAAHSPLTN